MFKWLQKFLSLHIDIFRWFNSTCTEYLEYVWRDSDHSLLFLSCDPYTAVAGPLLYEHLSNNSEQ